MDKLQIIYEQIAEKVKDAESRKAKYLSDIEGHKQRQKELKAEQENALQSGDSAAYLEASRAMQDEQIMIDFATRQYNAEASGATVDLDELRAIASRLFMETAAVYREKAIRIVPELRAVEKTADEAELLLKRYQDFHGMLHRLSRGALETPGVFDNRTVCIAGVLRARREHIEKINKIE